MNDLTHQGNITRDVTNDGGRFVSLSCPTYLLLLVVGGTLLLLVPATVTDLASAVHKATYGVGTIMWGNIGNFADLAKAAEELQKQAASQITVRVSSWF